MHIVLKSLTLFFLMGLSSAFAQESNIYIRVGEAQVKKSLMAFPAIQFSGNPSSAKGYQEVGAELHGVVKNDLDTSGYFQFIDPKAYLEDPAKTGLKPIPDDPKGFRWQSWQALNTEFLVRMGYSIVGDQVTLEGYVYHVPRQRLVLGRQYKGSRTSVRRVAHTFSNDIVEALTGKKASYLSRIVATSDRGGKKFKEIYVMDWDAQNPQKISEHNSIAISPAWSPDGKKITYTAFVQKVKTGMRNPDLFLHDLTNSNLYLLSYRKGMNSGSVFHPDGKSVYVTLTEKPGEPQIYQINLKGEIIRQITSTPKGVMNVEPAISPDGKKILYSSNRHGNPMIYIQNSDGSGAATRLTQAGRYNASPAWSPDGKQIAFASQLGGSFDLYIMNVDGTGLKRLTKASRPDGRPADSEDPTWSPCGRHIMFSSNRTGKKQLYIINPDGSNERRITHDNFNYEKPKWSPTFD